ncbi:hypothetical protein TeGR_g5108 [Tetraparma gracilis]|uniref:Signal recognition particle subunit SRP72 n=1 Tax=Tetraparma gracilis TaxID=2962635 RepID=A0ABQ6MHM7_9STRA|nr:hypothetical protein TeGR_g5108 [Tetraparma gracilis]
MVVMKVTVLRSTLSTIQNLLDKPELVEKSLLKVHSSISASIAELSASNHYPHNDNSNTAADSYVVDPLSYFEAALAAVTEAHLVSLVQQKKFAEVLSTPSAEDHPAYRCYAMYRLQRYQEAIDAANAHLSSHPHLSAPLSHIIAQSHFRLSSSQASRAYLDMLDEDPDDVEVLTNYLASLPSADADSLEAFSATGIKTPDHDLLYNLAWYYANPASPAHSPASSLSSLASAFAAAKKTVPPTSYASETAALHALNATLLRSRGKPEAAAALLKNLNQKRAVKEDPQLAAVVASNLLASSSADLPPADLAESRDALRTLLSRARERLNKDQAADIEQNLETLELFKPDSDASGASAAVQVAVAKFQGRSSAEQLRIAEAAGNTDETDRSLLLAQMAVDAGAFERAAAIIQQLPPDVSETLGAVRTVSDLLREAGKAEEASSYVAAMRSKLGGEMEMEVNFAAAEEKIASKLFEDAAAILEGILESPGLEEESSNRATAMLVVACSYFDVDKAEALAAELHAEEAGEIDAEELENNPDLPKRKGRSASQLLAVNTDNERAEKKRRQAIQQREKKEKKRLAYIEKLRELGKPVGNPDPERWLPKNQRSYNKRGKQKGKFTGGQGSGGATKDASKLDIAARMNDKKAQENSTAHLAVTVDKVSRRRK